MKSEMNEMKSDIKLQLKQHMEIIKTLLEKLNEDQKI